MALLTEYKYIEIDETVPVISGTTMKVVELITSHIVYGWSPEELHFQYPHISLSKIYSALSYYWDHRQQIEADMQRRFEIAEQIRLEAEPSPIAARLRTQGLIK